MRKNWRSLIAINLDCTVDQNQNAVQPTAVRYSYTDTMEKELSELITADKVASPPFACFPAQHFPILFVLVSD